MLRTHHKQNEFFEFFLSKVAVHPLSTPIFLLPLECVFCPLKKVSGVHPESTPKSLKCTPVHSIKIGVHTSPLQKQQNFGVENCSLQKNWSGKLFTPKKLERKVFHSNICGVDIHPLQKPGVHVVKVWSALSLTPYFLGFFKKRRKKK